MSSGALTSLGTYATGLQPVAIGIDPQPTIFFTPPTISATASRHRLRL